MIKFHFYDMDFGLKTDPVADLVAHRELLAEAERALKWAEHTGDKQQAIRLYEEISFRESEIRKLTRTERKRTA